MVNALVAMGFEIEAAHHEVAPGQHEIDFKYADALTTADNIATFKWVVKRIALNHGLHATFLPKPIRGINGSGMHTHLSLFKDGRTPSMTPTPSTSSPRPPSTSSLGSWSTPPGWWPSPTPW